MFATLLIVSAFLVIRAENPVHAVLYLVLVFCLNSCILLIIGAEFISLLLLIVYVGAIAILFLFVVMMLPIKNNRNSTILQDLPLGMFIAGILAIEMIAIVNNELPTSDANDFTYWALYHELACLKTYTYVDIMKECPTIQTDFKNFMNGQENAKAFGIFLYTHNYYYVIIAGFILLLAIVGAVMLARQDLKKPHKQNISHQMSRRFENAVLKLQIQG